MGRHHSRNQPRSECEAQLRTTVSGIRAEFNREIRDLYHSLDPASSLLPFEEHAYLRDFALWRQNAPHPEIVANVYAFTFVPNGQQVLQWSPASNAFELPSHLDLPATLSATLASYSPPVAYNALRRSSLCYGCHRRMCLWSFIRHGKGACADS